MSLEPMRMAPFPATRAAMRVLVADPVDAAGLMPLAGMAEVDVLTGLSSEQLVAVIADYDALIVRSQTRVDANVIAAGRNLQAIARAGAGIDTIDVEAATRHGVVVVNSPGGNTVAAAEHALALMFALARHVAAADASVKRGEWKRSAFMGTQLAGKTLGVLGLGQIGRRVAASARALGMDVVAHDPYVDATRAAASGVSLLGLETLLERADWLTLHLPKTAETAGLLDAAAIAKTRPGVKIVNCARGGLIDEEALAAAIRSGHVAGAALDVFEGEPAVSEALVSLGQRVVLTPHLGASTVEAQCQVALDVAEDLARIFRGEAAENAVALSRPGKLVTTFG